MTSFFIHGESGVPSAFADEKGHKLLLLDIPDQNKVKYVEDVMRQSCGMFGLFMGVAFKPFDKNVIQHKTVHYSISRCWRLGRAILEARKNKTDPMKVMEE